MSKKKKNIKLKRGDTVIWTPDNFNKEFWDKLSEEDRVKYYGTLGYGSEKKKLFVFMTRIFAYDESCERRDTGHCVLVDLSDGHIETMRHTNEFRHATEEEF